MTAVWFVIIVDNGDDKSAEFPSVEAEEDRFTSVELEDDETTKKLHVETETETPFVSVAEMESPCFDFQDSAGNCDWATSSAYHQDLKQQSIPCTSDFHEQCAFASSSSNIVADPLRPKAHGTEAAAAAATSKCLVATATSAARVDTRDISETSFDVQFSSEKNPDHSAISVAAYRRQEVNDIHRANEMIKSQFTYKTFIRLRSMGFDEERCKRLADLVMDGRKVKIKADVDVLRSKEDIYEFYRCWKTVENYQCLLISAPEIGNNDDSRDHKEEMANFCLQAFPPEHFDVARKDRTITWREVSNLSHVMAFIRDFFRRPDGIRAKQALHAVIVFFGHGSEQGFCVGQQDMSLNDIILLVKDEWREALLNYPEELPVKVEIIFSQCYGHLYDQRVQSDRFRVTAFTTSGHERTVASEDVAGRMNNDDLTPYATGALRNEVFDIEAWRHSDSDQFVDLTAAQRSRNSNQNQTDSLTREDSGMVTDTSDAGSPTT